jgi:hypothetical protein
MTPEDVQVALDILVEGGPPELFGWAWAIFESFDHHAPDFFRDDTWSESYSSSASGRREESLSWSAFRGDAESRSGVGSLSNSNRQSYSRAETSTW